MKELTIEDKAKRYDEAIDKIADVVEAGTIEQGLAEWLFPELRESEDEKIRKVIYGWIYTQPSQFFDSGFSKEEMLVWLEKQGEQKPTFVNNFRTWLYIVADVLTEFNGIGQYLDNSDCREMAERLREKYCFDDTSSDWQKVYQKGLKVGEIYGRNKAKKEQEQKLVEWSEEDERIYRSITYSFAHNFPLTIQQQEFVKSLKDRVQPKVELTQLDKNILEAAIAFVELNNRFNCWRGVDRQTVLSALHSLEPQNTWKPSDEQIKALEDAIEFLGCTKKVREDLKSLYEQLKRLKS